MEGSPLRDCARSIHQLSCTWLVARNGDPLEAAHRPPWQHRGPPGADRAGGRDHLSGVKISAGWVDTLSSSSSSSSCILVFLTKFVGAGHLGDGDAPRMQLTPEQRFPEEAVKDSMCRLIRCLARPVAEKLFVDFS